MSFSRTQKLGKNTQSNTEVTDEKPTSTGAHVQWSSTNPAFAEYLTPSNSSASGSYEYISMDNPAPAASRPSVARSTDNVGYVNVNSNQQDHHQPRTGGISQQNTEYETLDEIVRHSAHVNTQFVNGIHDIPATSDDVTRNDYAQLEPTSIVHQQNTYTSLNT